MRVNTVGDAASAVPASAKNVLSRLISNRLHNETHGDRVGFFGFFECIRDQDVADALFAAATDWCRTQGHDVLRGRPGDSLRDEPIVRAFRYNAEHPALMKMLFGVSSRVFHDALGWVTPSTGFRLPAMVLAGAMLGYLSDRRSDAAERPTYGLVAGVGIAMVLDWTVLARMPASAKPFVAPAQDAGMQAGIAGCF